MAQMPAEVGTLLATLEAALPLDDPERWNNIIRLRQCAWRFIDKTFSRQSPADFDGLKNYGPHNALHAPLLQANDSRGVAELQAIFNDNTKQSWGMDELFAKFQHYQRTIKKSVDEIAALHEEIEELKVFAKQDKTEKYNQKATIRGLQEAEDELRRKCFSLRRLATDTEAATNQVLGQLGCLLVAGSTGVGPDFRNNVLDDLALLADGAQSETRTILENDRCLDWDLAIVPPQLLRHPVDSNLPMRLWLYTCECYCNHGTLALIELLIHAMHSGVQLEQPQSAQLVLIAAVRMAQEGPDPDDDTNIRALCALRALEVVVRFRQPVNTQLAQSVCNGAAAILSDGDVLGHSLLRWLRGCLADSTVTTTLFNTIRQGAKFQLDVEGDSCGVLSNHQLRKSLIAESTGVLLLDYNSLTLSRYLHDEIIYSSGYKTLPFDVITFSSARRWRGGLSAKADPFVTVTSAAAHRWICDSLPNQVRDWVEKDMDLEEET